MENELLTTADLLRAKSAHRWTDNFKGASLLSYQINRVVTKFGNNYSIPTRVHESPI